MQKSTPQPTHFHPLARLESFPLRTALFVVLLCTNLAIPSEAAFLAGDLRCHLFSGNLFAVKFKPAEAKTDIGSIEGLPIDSTVEVQATIKSISKPGEGSKAPVKLTIADETGSIALVIRQDSFEVIESQYGLATGDSIRVLAQVTEFRNERQLTLRNVADISVLSKSAAPASPAPSIMPGPAPSTTPTPPPSTTPSPAPPQKTKPTTPLAKINQSMNGQEVYIQATISDIREPREGSKAPFIVTLSEGDSKVSMVFWSNLHKQIAQHIRVGNVIRATAVVSEYRGTLQLKLRNAKDIESVGAAPTAQAANPEPADGKATIGSITEGWANRTVTISGNISSSDSIGKGQRLRLHDDTGEIQVVLWDNVLSRIPATEFQSGRSVSVTGRVKVYRGQLEVVPDSAEGVKILAN
jgi:DNA/RNA endonuclease YhcR with UshA esterase domain